MSKILPPGTTPDCIVPNFEPPLILNWIFNYQLMSKKQNAHSGIAKAVPKESCVASFVTLFGNLQQYSLTLGNS